MNLKLRTISSFLLISFFCEQVSFAAADLKPVKFDLFEKPGIHFKLPESIASVEDAWKAPASDKLVYLIQDAHTNDSGQLNLSKTLDILLKEETALKYIFIEAGVGNDSLSFLRQYSSLKERKQTAMSYLKKGLLHGEEYLDITSDHNFVLWGVEDINLYLKAIENYRYTVKEREKFQAYLKKIEQTIDTLKPRIYNPLLLAFEEKQNKFLKEEISLTDYFDVLTQGTSIDLNSYPHLKALKNLKEKEAVIDFKKANEEQVKAIQLLSEVEQKELLELSEKEKSPFKLGSQDHKEQRGFYALLEEKLKEKVQSFPNLSKYFEYLKESKKLNPKAILEEQKLRERDVLNTLSKTSDEKSLLRCQTNLRYLQKLFNLTLTPEEYKEYKEESKDFQIKNLTGFLNKKIMDLKKYYERAIFLEEGYEKIVQASEEFYELTKARDEAFLKNMSSKMEKESQTRAVLITGGFHTPSLKALLKQRNISYICLTPQVTHETNQKRYEEILLNQKINPTLFHSPLTEMTSRDPEAMTDMAKVSMMVVGGFHADTNQVSRIMANPMDDPSSAVTRFEEARQRILERKQTKASLKLNMDNTKEVSIERVELPKAAARLSMSKRDIINFIAGGALFLAIGAVSLFVYYNWISPNNQPRAPEVTVSQPSEAPSAQPSVSATAEQSEPQSQAPSSGTQIIQWSGQVYSGPNWRSNAMDLRPNVDMSGAKEVTVYVRGATPNTNVVVQLLDKNTTPGSPQGASKIYKLKGGAQTLRIPISEFSGQDLQHIKQVAVSYGEEAFQERLNDNNSHNVSIEKVEYGTSSGAATQPSTEKIEAPKEEEAQTAAPAKGTQTIQWAGQVYSGPNWRANAMDLRPIVDMSKAKEIVVYFRNATPNTKIIVQLLDKNTTPGSPQGVSKVFKLTGGAQLIRVPISEFSGQDLQHIKQVAVSYGEEAFQQSLNDNNSHNVSIEKVTYGPKGARLAEEKTSSKRPSFLTRFLTTSALLLVFLAVVPQIIAQTVTITADKIAKRATVQVDGKTLSKADLIGIVYQPTEGDKHISYYTEDHMAELIAPLLPKNDPVLAKLGLSRRGQSDGQALLNMGVRYIRLYYVPLDNPEDIDGVKQILRRAYELYGIRVVVGHWMGLWPLPGSPVLSDDSKEAKQKVIDSFANMVRIYAAEPWVYMYDEGNESNYHVRGGPFTWRQLPVGLEEYYEFMADAAVAAKKAEREVAAKQGRKIKHPILLGHGSLTKQQADMITRVNNEKASQLGGEKPWDGLGDTAYPGVDFKNEKFTGDVNFIETLFRLAEDAGLPIAFMETGIWADGPQDDLQVRFWNALKPHFQNNNWWIGKTIFSARDEAWKPKEVGQNRTSEGQFGHLGKKFANQGGMKGWYGEPVLGKGVITTPIVSEPVTKSQQAPASSKTAETIQWSGQTYSGANWRATAMDLRPNVDMSKAKEIAIYFRNATPNTNIVVQLLDRDTAPGTDQGISKVFKLTGGAQVLRIPISEFKGQDLQHIKQIAISHGEEAFQKNLNEDNSHTVSIEKVEYGAASGSTAQPSQQNQPQQRAQQQAPVSQAAQTIQWAGQMYSGANWRAAAMDLRPNVDMSKAGEIAIYFRNATANTNVVVQLLDRDTAPGTDQGVSKVYNLKGGAQVLRVPISEFKGQDLEHIKQVAISYGEEAFQRNLNEDNSHSVSIEKVEYGPASSGSTGQSSQTQREEKAQEPASQGAQTIQWAGQVYSGSNWRANAMDLRPNVDMSKAKEIVVYFRNATANTNVVVQLLDKDTTPGTDQGVSKVYNLKGGAQTLRIPISEFSGQDLAHIKQVAISYGEEAFQRNLNEDNSHNVSIEKVEYGTVTASPQKEETQKEQAVPAASENAQTIEWAGQVYSGPNWRANAMDLTPNVDMSKAKEIVIYFRNATTGTNIIVQLLDKNTTPGASRGISKIFKLNGGVQVLRIPISEFKGQDLAHIKQIAVSYGQEAFFRKLNDDNSHNISIEKVEYGPKGARMAEKIYSLEHVNGRVVPLTESELLKHIYSMPSALWNRMLSGKQHLDQEAAIRRQEDLVAEGRRQAKALELFMNSVMRRGARMAEYNYYTEILGDPAFVNIHEAVNALAAQNKMEDKASLSAAIITRFNQSLSTILKAEFDRIVQGEEKEYNNRSFNVLLSSSEETKVLKKVTDQDLTTYQFWQIVYSIKHEAIEAAQSWKPFLSELLVEPLFENLRPELQRIVATAALDKESEISFAQLLTLSRDLKVLTKQEFNRLTDGLNPNIYLTKTYTVNSLPPQQYQKQVSFDQYERSHPYILWQLLKAIKAEIVGARMSEITRRNFLQASTAAVVGASIPKIAQQVFAQGISSKEISAADGRAVKFVQNPSSKEWNISVNGQSLGRLEHVGAVVYTPAYDKPTSDFERKVASFYAPLFEFDDLFNKDGSAKYPEIAALSTSEQNEIKARVKGDAKQLKTIGVESIRTYFLPTEPVQARAAQLLFRILKLKYGIGFTAGHWIGSRNKPGAPRLEGRDEASIKKQEQIVYDFAKLWLAEPGLETINLGNEANYSSEALPQSEPFNGEELVEYQIRLAAAVLRAQQDLNKERKAQGKPAIEVPISIGSGGIPKIEASKLKALNEKYKVNGELPVKALSMNLYPSVNHAKGTWGGSMSLVERASDYVAEAGLPLIIQEIGLPNTDVEGQSQAEKQIEFVQALEKVVAAKGNILRVNYFQYDNNSAKKEHATAAYMGMSEALKKRGFKYNQTSAPASPVKQDRRLATEGHPKDFQTLLAELRIADPYKDVTQGTESTGIFRKLPDSWQNAKIFSKYSSDYVVVTLTPKDISSFKGYDIQIRGNNNSAEPKEVTFEFRKQGNDWYVTGFPNTKTSMKIIKGDKDKIEVAIPISELITVFGQDGVLTRVDEKHGTSKGNAEKEAVYVSDPNKPTIKVAKATGARLADENVLTQSVVSESRAIRQSSSLLKRAAISLVIAASLSSLFSGIIGSKAHAAEIAQQAPISVELSTGTQLFSPITENGNTVFVTQDGLRVEAEAPVANSSKTSQEPSLQDLKAMKETVSLSVGRNLDAIVTSSNEPVEVDVPTGALPQGVYFDSYAKDLVAAMATIKSKPWAGDSVIFVATGRNIEDLRKIPGAPKVLAAQAPKGIAKVSLITDAYVEGLNVPLTKLQAGDVPAFEPVLKLAVAIGRVKKGDMSQYSQLVSAWKTLSGTDITPEILQGILLGQIDLREALQHALKPLMRVDIDLAIRMINLAVKMAGQAA